MILVLLGTQNNSFHRLLEEIEKNIENKNIQEEVIVQAGYTKYETNKMKIFETVSKEELEKLIGESNYVISHGGVGSMVMANQKGKKVIAVPRQKKYKEHVNDHQKSTVEEFRQKGYVMGIEEVEQLGDAIKELDKFEPTRYQKTESKVIKMIEEFIDNNENKKRKKQINSEKANKILKDKRLHIAIIVLGIIFVALSGFHSNIWFDEAYSVGISDRSFVEIWNIGGHDVHPVLYYWMLKIVSLLVKAWGVTTTAGKILAFRIFSIIPIAIVGILGYTHIRKDFGEKVGIIFSFLTFFIPEVAIYATEIRMYSWGMLAITILAIYAYRLVKQSNNKNWLIFFISSICSIYLHYYGLMAAGLINVCLLIYLIKNKRKQDTIKILVLGVIQAIAYLPWLVYFVSQLKSISNGFWIEFKFPDTIIEILSSQIIGNLNYYLGFVVSIALYIYLGITLHKSKEDKAPVKFSIGIYVGVIVAALIMTLLLTTSILYYRYLFIITGLYIFTISFILSKEEDYKKIWLVCTILVILTTWNNITLIKSNYDENNLKQFEYLEENVQEGDTIVYSEIGHGSTVAVWFPENRQYFYNAGNWGVEEAYKAFGENFSTEINTEFLNELSGRIWIIDTAEKSLYNELFNNEQYKVISEKIQWTGYHGYCLNMILVEKI